MMKTRPVVAARTASEGEGDKEDDKGKGCGQRGFSAAV